MKPLLLSEVPIPDWWRTKVSDIEHDVLHRIREGEVSELARSAGGRVIYRVNYGQNEPQLRGTANFNSAIGSGSEDAYMRKSERRYPVLMILAGVHGHEVEGMIAARQLFMIMEQGCDLRGRSQESLRQKLQQLRITVFPLLNPDGRSRVPYDGWCGLPQDEMTKYGQGTRKDGSLYRWRPSKAVHPMQGDVDILGGYFDDHGVNLMHDEWYAPMSRTTPALLKVVAAEGPDLLLNLHSYQSDAGVLQTNYVPKKTSSEILRFTSDYVYPWIQHYGGRVNALPSINDDTGRESKMLPSFNLTSMCYHAGATLSCTFESAHGILENPHTYEQIHDLHLGLLEAAVDYLLEKRSHSSI